MDEKIWVAFDSLGDEVARNDRYANPVTQQPSYIQHNFRYQRMLQVDSSKLSTLRHRTNGSDKLLSED